MLFCLTYPTNRRVPERSQVSRPGEALVSVMTLALQLVQVTCIGYGPKPCLTMTVAVTAAIQLRKGGRR